MASPARSGFSRSLLAGVLLGGLVLAVYSPALRGGFILDDDVFLTQNPLIRAADGLRRFWLTRQAPDYWPLTSTTLWLEWRLWGLHAAGYHATNLLLHLGSVFLLWRILRRLEIPGAGLAAALFALHPINVESVAWITQRKNLLAMIFFLGSIRGFLEAERPLAAPPAGGPEATGRGGIGWLALSWLAFLLGLLSKGSIVPLPFVLLGVIAWRRRLTGRDGLRLLPFFALAALFAGVNVWFQGHDTLVAPRALGGPERLIEAATVPWFYLSKILLPIHLAFVYPSWDIDMNQGLWWLGPLAMTGTWLWLAGRKSPPWRGVAYAWGYVCVMLLPVLGLTEVRFLRFSPVADHYAHLAMIGVVVPVAAAGVWLGSTGGARAVGAKIGAGALLLVLSFLTWSQCRPYRDAQTLYTTALERNPASAMLHNNLGFTLQEKGRLELALAQYREAVRLQPDYAEGQNNLGALLFQLGRTDEAAAHAAAAVRAAPDFAEANGNLGAVRLTQGRRDEGLALLRRALAEKPDLARAHYNLAGAMLGQGQNPAAFAELAEAVRLDPEFAEARCSLAALLFQAGRKEEALAEVSAAVRLRPGYADAHYNRGLILRSLGREAEAGAELDAARRLRAPAP